MVNHTHIELFIQYHLLEYLIWFQAFLVVQLFGPSIEIHLNNIRFRLDRIQLMDQVAHEQVMENNFILTSLMGYLVQNS